MRLLIRASSILYDDIDEMVELFVDMILAGTLGDFDQGQLNRPEMEEYLLNLIDEDVPDTVLIVAYLDNKLVGLLGAIVRRQMFSHSLRSAYEMPWYVKPCKNRKKVWFELLNAYESWAKKEDCDILTIGNYNKRLLPIYEKKGYSLYSETLRKRLK